MKRGAAPGKAKGCGSCVERRDECTVKGRRSCKNQCQKQRSLSTKLTCTVSQEKAGSAASHLISISNMIAEKRCSILAELKMLPLRVCLFVFFLLFFSFFFLHCLVPRRG